MTDIRLRFPQHPQADLPLGPGRHALAWRDGAFVAVVAGGPDAAITLCNDPRGLWLAVDAAAGVVHVNGRRVRRLAMLRVGDTVHVEGAVIQLLGAGEVPRRIPEARAADMRAGEAASRLVLRGVGGRHHGRCFPLGRPRTVGRLPECDIRIDGPDFAERHARLEPHGDRVVLRGLAPDEASVVNGERVHDAMLAPGDQVVFDAHHRFVVEAPGRPAPPTGPDAVPPEPARGTAGVVAQARRMPWLLLAAVLLAAALAALLLFGSV